jgi:type IV pilus assembly protein PilY1
MRIVAGNRQLWAANERWQCTWQSERGDNANSNNKTIFGIDAISSDPADSLRLLTPNGDQDRVVRVVVCNPTYYDASNNLENCQQYPNGNLKPTGLVAALRREQLDQLRPRHRQLAEEYLRRCLRKNVGSMADEINITTDGTFKAAPATGGIINTLNLMRIWGYGYTNGTYRSDDSGRRKLRFPAGLHRRRPLRGMGEPHVRDLSRSAALFRRAQSWTRADGGVRSSRYDLPQRYDRCLMGH